MLDPLAALRAQPHYRRAIGRMRPIALHPLPRRTGRCRPLRREISARPLWNATLSSVHDRAADLCGRKSRPSRASARFARKKAIPNFSGTFVLGCKPCFRNSANRGLGRPMPAKARRRLSATTYFHRSCVCAPLLLFWMGKPGPSAWREKSGCQRNGFC